MFAFYWCIRYLQLVLKSSKITFTRSWLSTTSDLSNTQQIVTRSIFYYHNIMNHSYIILNIDAREYWIIYPYEWIDSILSLVVTTYKMMYKCIFIIFPEKSGNVSSILSICIFLIRFLNHLARAAGKFLNIYAFFSQDFLII